MIPDENGWIPEGMGGGGAGGQVWCAYRNPHHPEGWSLRVQGTPVRPEIGNKMPEFWQPVIRPKVPR